MLEWIMEHTHAYAVWLALILVFFGVLIWRVQKDPEQPYDIVDILLDPVTRKASLDKHVLLLMTMLSAWVVVVLTLKDKPVETLLLGVLGIFVLQRGVRDTMAMIRGTDGEKK